MLVRLITGLIGVPFVIFIVLQGGLLMQIVGVILALIGASEYYRVVSKVYNPVKLLGIVATGIYMLGYQYFATNYHLFIGIFLVALLILTVLTYPKYNIGDIAITFVAPTYIGLFFGLILMMRDLPSGLFWVVVLFMSAWGSDTCAYFAGRFLGKKKLAPVLSPKKTVEGAIGGVVGAGIIVYIFSFVMNKNNYIVATNNELLILLIIGCIGAVLSQFGDLAASSIKRNMEEKDFGNLFPGHGGVLDRFDSILLIAPFIYMCALWLNI
ncbi:MAG: hypothetical protein ATN36_05940 [Epulopiscium sp. Nele67-Bin005]|nr:MAG: hypothetical protein ATN36_05940 [Epulopiscium sp. Nele67-Bin005]